MMMGNHAMTSAFMIQLPCMARLFMHDKTDWVEFKPWTNSN